MLSRTLGVPIFQEQVIKLAMVAAGFSGGEADQLRRAMASWKKNGKLLQFKHKLITGMQARGYQAEFAEQIFNQILGFGEYGFPESHSASFAVLAYVSAWLKCYYPALFYTSLLNSLPMGFYSASQLIQDTKRHNITILPVCVNYSQYDHMVIDYQREKALRLGLRIVKGFSRQSANVLLSNRPEQGFKSINEVKQLGLNRYALEQLASANAFYLLVGNRYQTRWQLMNQEDEMPLFSSLHSVLTRTEEASISSIEESAPEQTSFDFMPSEIDNLTEDYAATGITLGKHPSSPCYRSLESYQNLPEWQNSHKRLINPCSLLLA